MNAPFVMDSSAMIAIAYEEKRGRTVWKTIRANIGSCHIHSVNAYEVAAKLMSSGASLVDAWKAATAGGVRLMDTISLDMSLRAVTLKQTYSDLSLADCHCLAFAEDIGGSLLTTDPYLADASKIVEAIHLE